MRAGILHASRFVLLGGATALAFFAGGYFDEPRAWAGLVVWGLVAVGLLLEPRALPRSLGAWLAIGGLFAFGAFTLLSMLWAPIVGNAYHAGQIVFLYLGGLIASALLLRDPAAQRITVPALAAGALIVIGYGISERLLPGLLHFARSVSAQGRLEQPLTYWNAMGELAALGFVLSARVAGDSERAPALRATAAAACAPLGLGLYLSFSRGALFACVAGLVALVVLAPRRSQLEGLLIAVLAGALASAAAAPFRGVTSLAGPLGTRESQGAATLALLVLIAGFAAAASWWRSRHLADGGLRLPRHRGWIALGIICAGLALAIVIGSKETAGVPLSGGVSRFGTLQSNRYDYWSVAFRAFSAQPIHGVGAGGWSVWWLRYRPINDFAQDAHSLPLQTLAELGLVGILLLIAFFAGLALAARRAVRVSPVLAAGPVAGLVTYAAHAPLDWDWQMPAVTLVAIVLAGAVLALAERTPGSTEAVQSPLSARPRAPRARRGRVSRQLRDSS
ncbi:MAG TPA: O-antigen ligase family protein [Solirubrobacteraceae bacterium]|nr:O-antigen ligase family protein [Solirubrobacteraceae bacterium]